MSTKRSTTASSIVPLPRGTCSIWGTLVARCGCGHDKTPGVVPGVWVECWGVRSAGDLAGLEAGGAHVHALRGAVDRGADPLDVGVEATAGGLLGPRTVVAEARLL